MHYPNMMPGVFHARPNRFIAHIEINGQTEICHVKNTGRLQELLLPNARVTLQRADNPDRTTAYDLISVYKLGDDNGMYADTEARAGYRYSSFDNEQIISLGDGFGKY